MQVLEHLRREHAVIRRMLERAQTALAPLDRPVLSECLDFFWQFVDRAHARQEEHVLFVALAEWAPDLARGPVQAMQKEHNLARAYLRAAKQSIDGGPAQKGRLVESVRRYVEVMQVHLQKEDEALFDLAHVALPPSRDAELVEAMKAARREALDDAVHASWIAVAEDGRSAGTLLLRDVAVTDPAAPSREIVDARTLGEEGFEDDEETGYSMRAGGVLYDDGAHQNVWLHDFGRGLSVQANQFLIIDHGEGLLLDPGGPKVYPDVLAETQLHLKDGKLRYIFLSHQDPDIGTSLNAWLMDTKAEALVSRLWVRFLPHFGIDKLLADRLTALPDEGKWLRLGERELMILPAHFLHSCGNLQVYDPTSKILFSGDLGGAVGVDESEVRDFETYRRHLEAFHRRYMGSTRALRAWVRMVRDLDIECIAPQHGAMYRGPMVERFLDWAESFECGIDALESLYTLPEKG